MSVPDVRQRVRAAQTLHCLPSSYSMTYTIDRFKSGLGYLTTFTAVILAAACISGGGNADGTVVRDSVGIEIIESNQAAWGEGQEWQLSAEPLLEIGDAEGDSLYEFFRITGVHRTGDGGIVVANAGTSEIRFYDAEGRFLRAVGRRGEGPGEYRSIGRLDVVRDSLFVSDYGNVRISVLTLDGAFVRSVNMLALGLTIPRTVGLFSDGSILLWVDAVEDLEFKAGVNHAFTRYHLIDPTGASVDSVGRFYSGEHYVEFRDGGGYSSWGMPFGRWASAVTHEDTFYYTDGASISVTQYSSRGVPFRILRHPTDPSPVTGDDADRVIEGYLSQFDENVQRRLRRAYSKMPLPAAMPAVSALLVGSEGDLWVRQYRSGFEYSAWCWWIFSPTGRLLGSMCLPDGFTPHQIGSDFVLGVSVDDLGTERVLLYGLVR